MQRSFCRRPHVDLYYAYAFFKSICRIGSAVCQSYGDGRSKGRVSGERQFSDGRKDPNTVRVRAVSWWQDKSRLGQIEFTGNGLHGLIAHARCVKHNGQRIAAKNLIRENV